MNDQELGELPGDETPTEPPREAAEKNSAEPNPAEEELLEDEDFSYNPVPPRRVRTIKVTYRFAGRGLPLPYPIDEDE